MNEETKEKIKKHISVVMDRLIKRRVETEPFNEDEIERRNPFGYRLVPIEVWKGSKFERSFVTILGQGIFEQIAKIIAEGTQAIARNQETVNITINSWKNEKIAEILSDHRESNRQPNWNNEIDELMALSNPQTLSVNVKFDLYIERENGQKEYYSLKTVKPNLDQTEMAKRDMLRTKTSIDEDVETYFALPYNPAGEGNNYRSAGHSIPYKIFDMDHDPCVLIGKDFWNKVGDNENTYDELLELFSEMGEHYSRVIRERYFGE